MISERVKSLALSAAILLIVVALLGTTSLFAPASEERAITGAPRFNATDTDGRAVSLEQEKGRVVVLYFTYLNGQTCTHCKALNRAQLQELAKVRAGFSADRLAIFTIDMTYDRSGADARDAKAGYNMSWTVINDVFAGNNTDRRFEDTNIGGRYINYLLDDRGILINPTLLLLDKDLMISGVYHVGVVPVGYDLDSSVLTQQERRDLLTAAELGERVGKLERSEWGATMEGKVYAGVTLGGMFLLGIFVSITPCALMLLVSMTSYVTTVSRKRHGEANAAAGGKEAVRGPLVMKAPKNESEGWFGATIGLAFTLGIGLVFFLIGCLFTYIGVLVSNATVFYVIAGAILIAFGIHNIFGMGVIYERLKRSSLARPVDLDDGEGGGEGAGIIEKGRRFGLKIVDSYALFGAFFLGSLLALGWAPCALAFVFPALILVMTQQVPVLVGGLYLFVFSLGFGVPVIALATLTTKVKAVVAGKAMNFGKWIPKAFGVVITVIGLLMIGRYFGLVLW